MREADVLMAEIAEFRREQMANSSKFIIRISQTKRMDFKQRFIFLHITGQNDSQATIIIGETTDAAHPTNEAHPSTQDSAVAGTSDSANNSNTNNPIDGKERS